MNYKCAENIFRLWKAKVNLYFSLSVAAIYGCSWKGIALNLYNVYFLITSNFLLEPTLLHL